MVPLSCVLSLEVAHHDVTVRVTLQYLVARMLGDDNIRSDAP
jgi:hypothetical protein